MGCIRIGDAESIFSHSSLLRFDSVLCFSLRKFWRLLARDSGNCATRGSRFCDAKGRIPSSKRTYPDRRSFPCSCGFACFCFFCVFPCFLVRSSLRVPWPLRPRNHVAKHCGRGLCKLPAILRLQIARLLLTAAVVTAILRYEFGRTLMFFLSEAKDSLL